MLPFLNPGFIGFLPLNFAFIYFLWHIFLPIILDSGSLLEPIIDSQILSKDLAFEYDFYSGSMEKVPKGSKLTLSQLWESSNRKYRLSIIPRDTDAYYTYYFLNNYTNQNIKICEISNFTPNLLFHRYNNMNMEHLIILLENIKSSYLLEDFLKDPDLYLFYNNLFFELYKTPAGRLFYCDIMSELVPKHKLYYINMPMS